MQKRNSRPTHTHTYTHKYITYTQRDKQTNTYTRTQTRHRIDRRASQADLKGQRLKCSSGDVPLIAKTDRTESVYCLSVRLPCPVVVSVVKDVFGDRSISGAFDLSKQPVLHVDRRHRRCW